MNDYITHYETMVKSVYDLIALTDPDEKTKKGLEMVKYDVDKQDEIRRKISSASLSDKLNIMLMKTPPAPAHSPPPPPATQWGKFEAMSIAEKVDYLESNPQDRIMLQKLLRKAQDKNESPEDWKAVHMLEFLHMTTEEQAARLKEQTPANQAILRAAMTPEDKTAVDMLTQNKRRDEHGSQMDDVKLKKLQSYLNFASYTEEVVGIQSDKLSQEDSKMLCGCCEPACSVGCGWEWSRKTRGEPYLENGPPPLTKSDDFEVVYFEPKCMIKYLKRGDEEYLLIVAYPETINQPEVTIVPLHIIPPGFLGCDCQGDIISFYTWPQECMLENGEYFVCCFVCQKKDSVTAKGLPFAVVPKIADAHSVVQRIHDLRGLTNKYSMHPRPRLAREFSIKQMCDGEDRRGEINIYHEGYDTEDYTVRLDFNNDEQVSIKAWKESMYNKEQKIKIFQGYKTSVKKVHKRRIRTWISEDLNVYSPLNSSVDQPWSPSSVVATSNPTVNPLAGSISSLGSSLPPVPSPSSGEGNLDLQIRA